MPARDVGACELLSLAAEADPVRQYAAGRPIGDVLEVAALQREMLLAAANVLGPGPEADALAVLANSLVGDEAGAIATWSEQQWADALIARADPALLATIEAIEARC